MAESDKNLEIIASLDYSDFTAGIDDMQSMISDVEGGIDVDVTANAEGFDSLPFDEIPDETTTDLDITETSDAQQAIADIHFMALKDKIETVWNIIQKGVDIASQFVNPLLDVDDAVAHINAQTGNGTGIADLGDFIREIQGADLGTGVDQIEDVVIAATQLHAPIEEATRASLTFTHTFTDENPVNVMKTLKATADEFGVSITDASDLMTIFFQQGGNKGGDALATVDRYSTSWHDMGLSITEALSLVSSLMSGGVDTADAAAKMVQTFDDSFTTAATDPNSQQAKLLKAMGIDNPKDAGEAIGAETIDGFVEAFNNLPADQQDLASQLFFGKGGKLNTSAIAGATTQSDMFQGYKDAAIAAAADMDNSLRGAIDDFILAINTSVSKFLASDKVDIDGFITRLKDGFQKAVTVLAGGGSIGEALEIGFNIQGFDTFVANFQRILGNLEILLLQLVKGVGDLMGKDTTGLGKEIARLAEGQLSFDLKVANTDEIGGMIGEAINRGVDPDKISELAGASVSELIAGGDIDKAQALVDSLKDLNAAPTVAQGLNFVEATRAQSVLARGTVEEIQAEIDAGRLTAPVDIDTELFQEQIDAAKEQLTKSFGPEQNNGGILTSSLFGDENPLEALFSKRQNAPGAAGKGAGGVGGGIFGDVQTALDGITTSAQTATDGVQTSFDTLAVNMATPVGTAVGLIDQYNIAVDTMDTNTAEKLTENTVTTTFEELADSARENFQIVIRWLETTTGKIFEMDYAASLLSNIPDLLKEISEAVDKFDTSKLLAIGNSVHGGGGGGDTTNNNNTTVNQTNNISNNAQAAGAGYQFAADVRGQG